MSQIEMTIDSVRRNSRSDEWTVVLKEKGGECYLPICVGSRQASLISRELQGIGYAELDNYILSLTGIDTASCQVESVVVDNFENNFSIPSYRWPGMASVTRLPVHLLKRSLLLLEQRHLFSQRRKY